MGGKQPTWRYPHWVSESSRVCIFLCCGAVVVQGRRATCQFHDACAGGETAGKSAYQARLRKPNSEREDLRATCIHHILACGDETVFRRFEVWKRRELQSKVTITLHLVLTLDGRFIRLGRIYLIAVLVYQFRPNALVPVADLAVIICQCFEDRGTE